MRKQKNISGGDRVSTQVYRHEYKYRISNMSAELLKRQLGFALRKDKNSGASGGYMIRSLYFDDIDHTAYHEKLSGISERAKYRLRYYNYDTSYIVFEKKAKRDMYSHKESVRVTMEQANAMLHGDRFALHHSDQPLLQEFAALCAVRQMKPHVLVDYDRIAFTHPVSNVRVTLDLNLRTAPFKTDLFNSKHALLPVFPEGEQLMEVKFNEFLPEFIGDLLYDVPKTLVANSKYTICLSTVME